jgi:hypothetical protein
MNMRTNRSWNWLLWIGFLLVLVGFLSYTFFFASFPITRDDSNGIVRWVNLTENIAVRARPEQVLTAFNQIGRTEQ